MQKKVGFIRRIKDSLMQLTIIASLPFLLDNPGGKYKKKADDLEAKEKKAFEKFNEDFNPRYLEIVKSAQKITYAHHDALEAADKSIGDDYVSLSKDDDVQEKYLSTFRDELKKQIGKRFKDIFPFDYTKDHEQFDKFLESIGVPKIDDLKELVKGTDYFTPRELLQELTQYQEAFLQQHLVDLPAKYSKDKDMKKYFFKRIDLEHDIHHEHANDDDMRKLLVQHVLRGSVPKAAIRKEIRKRRPN